MWRRSVPGFRGLSKRAGALVVLLSLLSRLGPSAPAADSNIVPGQQFAWSRTTGWIDWRPSPGHGAVIGEFFCSGFLYSANLGWINLGNGAPTNGLQYQNDSAADFGVNLDHRGDLSGFAYSANAGWLNFSTNGAPRIDLRTGRLSGAVFGANIGWIQLDGGQLELAVDRLEAGLDSDGDGIPDAWETMVAGGLETLAADHDADEDGALDREEYLADTDPLNPEEKFQIVESFLSQDGATTSITWTARPTRQYLLQSRSTLGASAEWTDLPGTLEPTGQETISASVENGPNQERFFRIKAVRPHGPLIE